MVIIAAVISILAGVAIVFGRIFNAKMADKMGLFQGALMNYIAGLLMSFIITLIAREYLIINYEVFRNIPLWAYFGGVLGIAIVVLSSYLSQKVSVFYLTLLIFIGQLVTGLVIDYFVTKEVPVGKSIGGILVLIGFLYNLKVDQEEDKKVKLKEIS